MSEEEADRSLTGGTSTAGSGAVNTGAVSSGATGTGIDRSRVGNAPCSWGTIEESVAGTTEYATADPPGGAAGGPPTAAVGERVEWHVMLDELTETGYNGTELGDYGFMPTDPERLRDELEERGLTMLGAFEGVNLSDAAAHRAGCERVLRNARLLSAVADLGDPAWRPKIVLADDNGRNQERSRHAGRIREEMGLGVDQWRVLARGAQEIAAAVADEYGLETVFHPHCAGFVETPAEIDRLLELTDPGLLNIVFDTGHFLYGTGSSGGTHVPAALDHFRERITYVHFKDCHPGVAARARNEGWDYRRAVAGGVFCELGRGAVDFAEVLAKLRDIGYDGWITVEQDVLPGMGSPKESARRNRQHLTSLGL